MPTPTPAETLRAAATRARELADPHWSAVARLLDGYGTDWDMCPADHPGTALDEYALAVARVVLGEDEAVVAAQPEAVPDTSLRDRIAEAMLTARRTDYDGAAAHGQHRYDARCALCAADVDALTDAVLDVLPVVADRAQWDALCAEADRLRTASAEMQAEAERINAEVEQLRAYRAAILQEVIAEVRAVPVQCTALTGPTWYGQGWEDAIREFEEIAERLAGEAQQPEAHRPVTEFIAEVLEDDGMWMYLGTVPDRAAAEKRCASVSRRYPDAETRIVRKTTTYTVETEEPTPAPQCSAGLLPATDAAVDRCVRHGAHDTHVTAAGARWPSNESK